MANFFWKDTKANLDGIGIKANGDRGVVIDSSGVATLYYHTGGAWAAITNFAVPQVAFPATQAASSDANTLDDYEESTWTPAMAGSLGDLSYSYQLGRYTKIGRMVVAYGTLNFTKGTASGTATMSGLPFTPESTYSPFVFWVSGYTPTVLSGHSDGGTGIQLFKDNGGTYVTFADFATSTTIKLCITYFV